MKLQIRNHGNLQGAVGRSVLASSTYFLGTALLGGQTLAPWVLAGAVGVLGLAIVPPRNGRSLAVTATLVLAAAGASRLGAGWSLVAAAALAGAICARELTGAARRLVAAATGSAGVALGGAVLARLAKSGHFDGLSSGLQMLGAGATMGLFAGLGAVGRELDVLPNLPAVREPLQLPGELGALLERADQAFTEAQSALGEHDGEIARAAADLMTKVERFGRRWHDLDAELGRADRAALRERFEQARQRAESAQDEVVRTEYTNAQAALAKQLDYLEGIERSRERALARLHHQVAVLERLRFAAFHRRAAAAGRAGEELQPLLEDLVAAGRDLDCEAEALAEVPLLASG